MRGEKERCTEKSEKIWDHLYVRVSHLSGYLPGDKDAKFDGENAGCILGFAIRVLPFPTHGPCTRPWSRKTAMFLRL